MAGERLTPEQFFDEVVPHIMSVTAAQRATLEGVCEIHLFGERETSWTINLKAGTVKSGGGASPDLCLEMDRDDFQAMMQNRLDVERAILGGRVRYEGKLPVLQNLAFLLQPRSMEY